MPISENIRHITNKNIDKQKWDNTILNSLDGRIYAQSIWLDNLSPNWNALVLGDYDVVMPLPSKKKLGIKYLAQPPFSQQLGVFSTKIIEPATHQSFIHVAQQLYKFGEISIHLSKDDIGNDIITTERKNYLLDISVNYTQIRGNYSNDLTKKNLQRSKKFNLQYIATNDVETAIRQFKQLYADRTPYVTEQNYEQLLHLAKEMLLKKQAFVREVRLPNNQMLACGLFFKDEKRIYNIASSTLPDGRTVEANHFLFDKLIQEFAGQILILDFEGSDLPGVERFYKKFGAILEPYYFIKWNSLPKLIKLFKS